MKTKYFDLEKISTLEDLKGEYKRLALELYGKESFEAMGKEYNKLFKAYKTKHVNFKTGEAFEKDYGENEEAYKGIIDKYVKYAKKGLTMEVIGCFVYIGGNILNPKARLCDKTKELGEFIRGMLKEDKFHYSNEKRQWCFSTRPYRSLKKNSWGMDRIRDTYGNEEEEATA